MLDILDLVVSQHALSFQFEQFKKKEKPPATHVVRTGQKPPVNRRYTERTTVRNTAG
jgi:hypothetical protein